MNLEIPISVIINCLPYTSPERFMRNGEGYKVVDSVIMMSVYYYKFLHNIEGNTNDNNAEDSRNIDALADYQVKTHSKEFEYVNLYPIKVLDDYFEKDSRNKLMTYKLDKYRIE